MNQPDSIGQTKTYWIVCEATPDYRSGDPTKEKWFERSGLTCTCEKDGQRKLRWLRQWHPNAFLAKATITPVPDKFKSPFRFVGVQTGRYRNPSYHRQENRDCAWYERQGEGSIGQRAPTHTRRKHHVTQSRQSSNETSSVSSDRRRSANCHARRTPSTGVVCESEDTRRRNPMVYTDFSYRPMRPEIRSIPEQTCMPLVPGCSCQCVDRRVYGSGRSSE